MKRLALLLALLSTPALAQAPSRPPIACASPVIYNANVGAAWTDVAPADWTSIGPYAATSASRFVDIYFFNRHATQVLYVILRPNQGEATTLALPVRAGTGIGLSQWGSNIGTISLQGSGAATTADLIGCMVKP